MKVITKVASHFSLYYMFICQDGVNCFVCWLLNYLHTLLVFLRQNQLCQQGPSITVTLFSSTVAFYGGCF